MRVTVFFILSIAASINYVNSDYYGCRALGTQFGFAAAIYSKGVYKCNGAIISFFHIITAAHCIYNEKIIDLRVIISMTVTPMTPWRRAQNIHIFSGYDPRNYDDDIGIIQLMHSLISSHAMKHIDYKETGINCAIELDCLLIRFKVKETDSVCKTTQSLWWHGIKIILENGHRKLLIPRKNQPELGYSIFKSKRLDDSGAPIVCNGKLTAILNVHMTDTADMATTVVMTGPYENWIDHKISQFEIENPQLRLRPS